MKLTKLALLPLCLMSVFLAGCGDDDTKHVTDTRPMTERAVTIETLRGPVTIPDTPRKMAVFDMGTLDTLTSLGVTVAGVPDNVYIPSLKEAASKAEKVGTLFEPNLETLYHMKPDLVVLSMRTSPKYEDVARIAPVIDMSNDTEDQIAEGLTRLKEFGKLMGKEKEARALHDELSDLIAETKAASEGAGTGLVIMVSGGKLSAFSAHSRFGWIYQYLGFKQVTDDMKRAPHGQPISFEFIQKTNPDWLFVIDRGASIGEEGKSAKSVLDNAIVRDTKAWSKDQVVYLSLESYIAPGGIRQIRHDLTLIRDALKAAKE